MDKKNLKKNYHNNISILSANGEMNLSILYIYIYICFFWYLLEWLRWIKGYVFCIGVFFN